MEDFHREGREEDVKCTRRNFNCRERGNKAFSPQRHSDTEEGRERERATRGKNNCKGRQKLSIELPSDLRVELANFVFKRFVVLLSAAVVLLVVDLVRYVVLLAIDLGALLRRQRAAVGGAVVADFAVDAGFLALEIRRFARRQLAALDPLRDPVLLIFGALPNFTLRVRVLHGGVVPVLINLLRELVLLLGENPAIGSGQLAGILAAHQLFFFVEIRFFLLEIGGFAGGQLAAGYAVRDAVLLVFLALVDGGRRIRRGI